MAVAPKPTATPIPIQYVTLGSPFAPDCGDGIPIIRANSAFNGIDKDGCIDDTHGHSDVWIPNGCNVNVFKGEVISPADGNLVQNPGGWTLYLPEDILPVGVEKALEFAGIKEPDITLINSVRLELGHVEPFHTGSFRKGESLGEIIPVNPSGRRVQYMLAYWVGVVYKDEGYAFSPSLFLEEGIEWPCVKGITLENECFAIPNNYPQRCNQ